MATKAIDLISKSSTLDTVLLLIFIFLVPTFGKSIDYAESIIFYTLPPLITISVLAKRQLIHLFQPRHLLWVSLLIVSSLISTIFSANIGLSLYQLLQFLNVILVTYLVIHLITPQQFVKTIIYSSFFYSLIFLLQYWGVIHLETKVYGDNFIRQIWGHSYLSDLLVFSIPPLILSLRSQRKRTNLFVLLIICLTLILSQSRSSLLALLIGLFFLNTHGSIQKNIKTFLFISIIGILMFVTYQSSTNNTDRKSFGGYRLAYWQQAFTGFTQSPLFGFGLNSFGYINKKYQTSNQSNSTYAHNSLLASLCENGLLYTLLFWSGIFIGLKHSFRSHPLFFSLSIIAITNSFFDPSWNSSGIFIISLYFIFYHYLHRPPKTGISPNPKVNLFAPLVLSLTILTFFGLQITSEIFYFRQKYSTSLFFDPINLNSRLSLVNTLPQDSPEWKKNLNHLLYFYHNDLLVYQTLIKAVPFPKNTIYYQKILELNPRGAYSEYLQLAQLYSDNHQPSSAEVILTQIASNLDTIHTPELFLKQYAKLFYQHGLYLWQLNEPLKAINFFQKATNFGQGWSYYYIDLANAHWASGNTQLAKQILLIDCQRFDGSIKHCQQYFDSHLNTSFEQPGFMAKSIENY